MCLKRDSFIILLKDETLLNFVFELNQIYINNEKKKKNQSQHNTYHNTKTYDFVDDTFYLNLFIAFNQCFKK